MEKLVEMNINIERAINLIQSSIQISLEKCELWVVNFNII